MPCRLTGPLNPLLWRLLCVGHTGNTPINKSLYFFHFTQKYFWIHKFQYRICFAIVKNTPCELQTTQFRSWGEFCQELKNCDLGHSKISLAPWRDGSARNLKKERQIGTKKGKVAVVWSPLEPRMFLNIFKVSLTASLEFCTFLEYEKSVSQVGLFSRFCVKKAI